MSAPTHARTVPPPAASLRQALASLLPDSFHPRAFARRRLARATRDGVVLGGPFAGMHYVRQSVGSMWWPKILGTYELELADLIRELAATQPDRIVDVGAAEGYYAVGLARLCPGATVISFEGDPEGRRLQRELAARNNVGRRLHVHGFCDHAAFHTALGPAAHGLIICDIEGAERTLLDPRLLPELADGGWTLLVEIHDHISAGIASVLIDRFEGTHTIEEYFSRPRQADDLPRGVRSAVLARWLVPFLDERRPGPMRWLLLRPAR